MPQASVDVGTIRQRFNFDWAMSEPIDGVDTYWWWARSVRVDPNEVIADDDEGAIWSVPFTTDGEDGVTFGAPTRVRETYVPVAVGDGAAASAVVTRRSQRVLAAALERPAKPSTPLHPSAASAAPTQQEEARMPINLDSLRSRLGLPEDATEEQINEALAADPAPVVPEAEVTERVETAVAAAREEERQRASAAQDGTVRIDADMLAELRANAAAGLQAREQQVASERASLVEAAVQDGRIPPARREHWTKALNADPEGAAASLNSLEPGLIPVRERGNTTTDDNDLTAAAASAGTGWFAFDDEKGA